VCRAIVRTKHEEKLHEESNNAGSRYRDGGHERIQYNSSKRTDDRARAAAWKGRGIPASGERTRLFGNTHFNAEVELLLPRVFPGSGITGVNVGYSQGSRDGNKLRMIPVTVEKLFGLPNPAAAVTGNIYGGAGIGPYFVRVSGNRGSESKTTIGGFGVVGYQFPSKLFVEAKYHLAGRVGGVSPKGFALLVGRSF
jgi:hypothetical protein